MASKIHLLALSVALTLQLYQSAAESPPMLVSPRVKVDPVCCDASKKRCEHYTLTSTTDLSPKHMYLCSTTNKIFGPRKPFTVPALFVNKRTLKCTFHKPLGPSIYTMAAMIAGSRPGRAARVAVFDAHCMKCIKKRGVRFLRGKCFVDHKCRNDNDVNPRNPLQICNSRRNKVRWTKIDPCKKARCSDKCALVRGKAICRCPANKVLNSDGKNCDVVDLCKKAGCSDACSAEHGKAICRCKEGYQLAHDQKNCKDSDECLLKTHDCEDRCINTKGAYRCECTKGTLNVDKKSCDIVALKSPRVGVAPVCCDASKGNCNILSLSAHGLANDAKYECTIIDHIFGKGKQLKIPAIYVDTDTLKCNYPQHLSPAIYGVAAIVGHSAPGPRTLIAVFDSGCMSCVPKQGVRFMAGTCFIDKKCRKHLDVNPRNPKKVCNSRKSKIHWSAKAPCPIIDHCSHSCPTGYRKDSNGCTTCDCIPCPVRKCQPCKFGYKKDEKQCSTCECNVDLCVAAKCSQRCSLKDGKAACSCKKGFSLGDDGKICTDIDECKLKTDRCQDKCINIPGSYVCKCTRGKLRADGRTCQRAAVLRSPRVAARPVCCDSATTKCGSLTLTARKLVSNAEYSCAMINKIYGPRKPTKVKAVFVNPTTLRCTYPTMTPSIYGIAVLVKGQKPGRGARIAVFDSRCMRCVAKRGVQFLPGKCFLDHKCRSDNDVNPKNPQLICNSKKHKIKWTKIDPCTNAGCSDKCAVVKGKPACLCPANKVLNEDGKNCDAVNLCSRAGCSDSCSAKGGKAVCSCRKGYQLDKDQKTCKDADECLLKTHDCEDRCINTKGAYRCICTKGTLNVDGKSCDIVILKSPRVGASPVCCDSSKKTCNTLSLSAHNLSPGAKYQCTIIDHIFGRGKQLKAPATYVNSDTLRCTYSFRLTPAIYGVAAIVGDSAPGPRTLIAVFDSKCMSCIPKQGVRFMVGACFIDKKCHKELDVNPKNPMQICYSRRSKIRWSKKAVCPKVKCNKACLTGYLRNSKGCQTCKCVPCPEIQCPQRCEHGYRKDAKRCQTCECKTNPCEAATCPHRCTVRKGKAVCSCKKGFLLGEDKESCSDIDECKLKTDRCEDKCINTKGNYRCVCTRGKLRPDGRTCLKKERVRSPRVLPSPVCCDASKVECGTLTLTSRKLSSKAKYTCAMVDRIFGPRKPKTVRAVFVNSKLLTCSYPPMSPSIYSIAVMVKGQKPGPAARIAVFDSRCMKCIQKRGVQFRPGTCFVDRKCRQDNDANPKNPMLICDSKRSKVRWSKRDPCKTAGCSDMCAVKDGVAICSCPAGKILARDHKKCNQFVRPQVSCPLLVCPKACPNGYLQTSRGCSTCRCRPCAAPACRRACPHGYKKNARGCDTCNCKRKKENPCNDAGCAHKCSVINDTPVCGCKEGYALDADKRSCRDVDECTAKTDQCQDRCVNIRGGYVCECTVGELSVDGKTCANKGQCGECSHNCVKDRGHLRCTCPPGYRLAKDDRTCIDIDECLYKNGGCDMICRNTLGGHECICHVKCLPGFIVSNKKCIPACSVKNGGCSHDCETDDDGEVECSCPGESRLATDGKTCKDPCLFKRGGCHQLCKSNKELEVTCSCVAGFILAEDGKTCDAEKEMECKKDEIVNPSTEKCAYKCDVDNGECGETECDVNEKGVVSCTCPKGEVKLSDGDKCAKICNDGYKMNMETGECKDIDECKTANGDCQDLCVNSGGSYKCVCRDMMLNTDGKTCTPKPGPNGEKDKCKEVDQGGCQHICVTQGDEYRCECKLGFVLAENRKHCIGKCKINNGGCGKTNCRTSSRTGKVRCSCKQDLVKLPVALKCVKPCKKGFKMNMETGKCIGPCATKNGGCQDKCENSKKGAKCSCPNGGHLALDNKKCVKCDKGFKFEDGECTDIDECALDGHGCEHECINIVGNYRCECEEGSNLGLDGKKCTRVNPCKKKNGGCQHKCVHDEKSNRYECRCMKGYILDNDKHSCISKCDRKNGGCGKDASCDLKDGVPKCSCQPGYVLDKGKNCKDICKHKKKVCDQQCSIKGATKAKPYTCSCELGFVLVKKKCVEGCSVKKQGCEKYCVNKFDGKYTCKCEDTDVLNANGKTCDDKDECKVDNGECTHTCTNKVPGHKCECPKTMELDVDGKTCITHNPCEKDEHECKQICVHEGVTRQYRCECKLGWQLADDKKTCIDTCHVKNGGCVDGTCEHAASGKVVCKCKTGLRLLPDGKTCVDIDECAVKDKHKCDEICHNTKGSYKCSCSKKSTLDTDGFSCTPVDPCKTKNGGCSHKCVHSKGESHCTCPHDYKLDKDKKTCKHVCDIKKNGCDHICVKKAKPAVCKCNKGWKLLKDGKSCDDIDECHLDIDGCQKGCVNEIGTFRCTCPKGLKVHPKKPKKCKDINECKIKNGDCEHECTNTVGSFKCTCKKGFELKKDHKHCKDIKECDKPGKGGCSHICVEEKGTYHCKCKPGYKLANDGKTCTDIPECDENKGGCAHLCEEKPGTYSCACREGYKLARNEKDCEDVNECKLKPPRCDEQCENLVGSYKCKCPKGFLLSKDGKSCKDDDECADRNGGCSNKCVNKVGSYYCTCPKGYKLDIDKRKCIDIDECLKENGRCDHICKNTEGSHKCKCKKGFKLAANKKKCKDVNECKDGPGEKCAGDCKNLVGSFKCFCPLGMKLNENGFGCDRVERCKGKDKSGCDQKCRDPGVGKKVICSCKAGYKLQKDKKTCKDIDECAKNNGGCRQNCFNVPGSYRCECDDPNLCKKGYAHDIKTDQCIEIMV